MSDYRGVYVLMEKIKISEGRVEIEPLENDVTDPELIQGGYIFKRTNLLTVSRGQLQSKEFL